MAENGWQDCYIPFFTRAASFSFSLEEVMTCYPIGAHSYDFGEPIIFAEEEVIIGDADLEDDSVKEKFFYITIDGDILALSNKRTSPNIFKVREKHLKTKSGLRPRKYISIGEYSVGAVVVGGQKTCLESAKDFRKVTWTHTYDDGFFSWSFSCKCRGF
jgi:hypothetical protein